MVTKKIKTYRFVGSIKQEVLANLIGVTLTTYCNKENGKTEFTLKEAKTLADFFGTTIDDLFFNPSVNFPNTV
ncbi:helix-turn-helix domain-containing protein [Clostridium baratii]|uniref:helix-turn-helix transcriptional regulator n=1 Tax=Clostridium baratii TaxID=1561 RepID=UPI0036F436A2